MSLDTKALAMMRRILPPEHPNIAYTSSALINTLALANEARALAGLFPLVSDLGAIESVFREVLLATKGNADLIWEKFF